MYTFFSNSRPHFLSTMSLTLRPKTTQLPLPQMLLPCWLQRCPRLVRFFAAGSGPLTDASFRTSCAFQNSEASEKIGTEDVPSPNFKDFMHQQIQQCTTYNTCIIDFLGHRTFLSMRSFLSTWQDPKRATEKKRLTAPKKKLPHTSNQNIRNSFYEMYDLLVETCWYLVVCVP